MGNYFRHGCHPSLPANAPVVVQRMEEKLSAHLERQGLGCPYEAAQSVKSVLDGLTVNQGGFLEGADPDAALDLQLGIIVKMVQDLDV